MPATPSSNRVTIFGIRHHGPGCARALCAALQTLEPDLILIEGPPDAQELLTLAAHPEMVPPVALLIYAKDEPRNAVYFPFTEFSPEWQALRYAAAHGIPARFMDLPQAVALARRRHREQEETGTQEGTSMPRRDPFAVLAAAQGHHDREQWWEQQVEQRTNAQELFVGLAELMLALRARAEPDQEEALREASMRQAIRTAQREGFLRIAVVCGAWHAPALEQPGPAKDDAARLARLPRLPVLATWIPWTYARLTAGSEYGAGIVAPGWYEQLWLAGEAAPARWLARAARLLRERDLEASPAAVTEALRMAEALAALRQRSRPGLAELQDAILTVLCGGSNLPMRVIEEQLLIGDRLGAVPEHTPSLPLQRDLTAQQRRLRLPPTAEARDLDLDLRKDLDRARSTLLHRLDLLDLPWGRRRGSGSSYSTFHERWLVRWQPEFALRLVEANVWGPTVESAAAEKARRLARDRQELAALSALLDSVILADLPVVVPYLLGCIGGAAALAADVRYLMEALPPLIRVARYSDVRGTRAANVQPVIDALFERIVIGLVAACTSLDDQAAAAMASAINAVEESVRLMGNTRRGEEWVAALRELSRRESVHALIQGRACRLLLEARDLEQQGLTQLARTALAGVVPAPRAAAWIEGLLSGSGTLLVHQDTIWHVLDQWLQGLSGEAFVSVLPLLRRTFSTFSAAERRAMGDTVHRLGGTGREWEMDGMAQPMLQQQRADLMLPVLARLLGAEREQRGRAGQ